MSVVTVILFTFFVPGVVVTFNKNKTMAALLHGVLFAIAFSFVHTYVGRDMEGFANTITCKGVVRLVSNNPSNHATRATSWTCPAGNTCGGAAGSCIAPAHADALSSALNNAGNFVTSALNK